MTLRLGRVGHQADDIAIIDHRWPLCERDGTNALARSSRGFCAGAVWCRHPANENGRILRSSRSGNSTRSGPLARPAINP
ncbi:hypothetical protein [Bradyrhizobium sp. ORS 285]|nr:hypothetical protein [Bradyrhizobium sp. ORS 285]